jgi:hypothetical protein
MDELDPLKHLDETDKPALVVWSNESPYLRWRCFGASKAES